MARDWPLERRCNWELHALRPTGVLRLHQIATLRCHNCWQTWECTVHRPWPWERVGWTDDDLRDDAEAQALNELPAWAAARLCHRHLRSV